MPGLDDWPGELRRDPPNTLETKDWKSTRDLKWAKNAEQVASTIQMPAYAMAGFKIAELIPITRPFASTSGPPELPGLTAASVCSALR